MPIVNDHIKEKIRVNVGKLKELSCTKSTRLDYKYTDCPEYKKDNVPPSVSEGWKDGDPHHVFSGKDYHYWIHTSIRAVPSEIGRELRFRVKTGREGTWDSDANPQFTVFIDGKTVQALDCNHTWIPLEFDRDYEIDLYLFTGMCYQMFEVSMFAEVFDLETEALYYDMLQPYEAMGQLKQESNEYITIRNYLDRACLKLDFRYPYSEDYYASVKAAREFMRDEFYGKACGQGFYGNVYCLGHTHIDVAWLWTLAQTREKAQRSFSTVINMMKRYPEYKFFSSQPQLYKYVKESDPELYAEIKEMIKLGRWEPEGAMWLEADTNLISGESLIRQMIYGMRFMKDEFGAENKILWLPDVFGYSGALPQIMNGCGVKRFFTTKMIWNENNRMPNDLFIWEGIDGSEVFCAFASTYVPPLNAANLKANRNGFKSKEMSDTSIMVYGWGDGGGGPTYDMIENYRRVKHGIPGIPTAKIATANEYFDIAEKNFAKSVKEHKTEPRWVGEMYLEMHRGTYTSMAKNKKNNRISENLYFMLAESAATADMIFNGSEYPEELFRKNIENILLNQFHDIIPGSSIKEVYEDTDRDYARIIKDGEKVLEKAISGIAGSIKTEGGIFVYNASPYTVSDFVTVDGKSYYAENVPARGFKVIAATEAKNDVTVTEKSIENDRIRVVFDEKYHIASIYDKEEGREVVANKCNILEVYEDYPREFDAWEISPYYEQKRWYADGVSEVKLLENGIRVIRKYQSSVIKQDILLTKNSKRIDFKTEVDWHEDHVLLRAAFPVDIHSDFATYDIQFGNLTRPTHRNTSWDAAKFEVCAHKWADLSESDYGVSLLSDCKYGYSVHGNVMGISLLKAATYPNPEADRGVSEFTYSLYPHTGDFRVGETVKEGYKLNIPLMARMVGRNDGNLPDALSLATADKDNIVIETLKKAEGDDSIIVRLYDAYNCKTNVKITLGFDFKKAYLCDMLENNISLLDVDGKTVSVPVKNYEIVTLKFTF